ncbi:MAG: isochorismatase family protein [Nitrososphaerota archaeon]|nr:isochorismatase family protein [Nitrososphaerota archaeon]MDG6982096.1 isochorismatase family protein [Nitrososphaerota archaeon]
MSSLAIDGAKTALVVIDLQKGITSMDAQPNPTSTVVANAALLAGAFRERGMPVYLVRVSQSRGTSLSVLSDTSFPSRGEMPPDWADIVPELGPAPSDVVITKRQWGAFYGTDLELRLRRGSTDSIVLCGIATTYGVESTARFAYEYGFQQLFAEDAMSDRSADAHRNAVEFVLKRIGRVRKTREILDALPRP